MTSPVQFWKYEGLGNDFIVVESSDTDWKSQATRLCDRHTGIGADGILVLSELASDGPRMRVWNADGSHAEMCGNGLRCAALHRQRRGFGVSARWNTDGGPHDASVREAEADQGIVEVDMARPTLEPSSIPLEHEGPLVGGIVEIEREALHITAVGMGNPHAVLFGDFGEEDRRMIGPAVQRSALFPSGVNVGFASARDDGFELHVLERGAGWTRACGTGACAAAVAALVTGRAKAGSTQRIELPGGTLFITVHDLAQPVRMAGPARFVFEGVVS